MRKGLILLAIAFLTFVSAGNAFALQGGPDVYGYTWMDSNEPGGPSFSWKEIQGAPGAIEITGLADDNSVGPINMGWSFQYYWTLNNSFKFGSNGWVGFSNIGNIAHCFPTIPTAGGAGNNFIAPFMTDLNFTGTGNPGEVWYWDNGVDTLIIEWANVPWWVNTPSGFVGDNTFQLILSGVDSSITFMYKDMDPANFNDTPGCAADMVTGIENLTGNIGLQVNNESIPADSYAVKFYYPNTVTFQVPDATPNWAANADNAGQFYLAGPNASSVTLSANIKNVGNAPITSNITVNGVIAGGILNSSTIITGGLPAGDDSTVTFPNTVTFANGGNFTFNVTTNTAGGQDINPSNNSTSVEVVAVECENDTVNLGYSVGSVPDGVIVWSGGGAGSEGGGIYITPPSYPATIEAIDLFIADIDQDPLLVDSYSLVIYDDNGAPGTMLDSVFVPNTSIIENVWARIQLNGTATITSGGFYVGWYQGGSNVALGTEAVAPISRRTYEIIGGQWAPYRNGTVDDFLMKAHVSTVCPSVSIKDPKASNILLQAVPNPTQGLTQLQYTLPVAGDVRLSVIDIHGKEVFNTVKTGLQAGNHAIDFNTESIAAGLYFVKLEQGADRVTSKLVVNR